MNQEIYENLRMELRRGCLILAVLAALRSEQYGYTLRKALAEKNMTIDEGTLYPLLRRLESQGLSHQPVAGGGEPQQAFLPAVTGREADPETVAAGMAEHQRIIKRYPLRSHSMELLERYLHAVGFWLPKTQKQDIGGIIKTSIPNRRKRNGGWGPSR